MGLTLSCQGEHTTLLQKLQKIPGKCVLYIYIYIYMPQALMLFHKCVELLN